MSKLKLSPAFAIDAIDFANQANAVLGIREAGKTYTAMKAAEELLEVGIPIIVFDPVGVWQNLKIGTGTHKGYPVVVAGGDGADIRLTKDNAVEIVRAAMKENISLVIDLYSPELINKSTWIYIVQSAVDLLMYENKSHGLRHIFLEEAAEFIPQKLQPQHAKVYASIERLARMGRNAKLGMTIINQRAEEVNKAILEICELSLLHKQVGKNSMLSIKKWLEVRQIENVNDIIKSLPVLKKGECWAIGEHPQRIQVSTKNTYHPNPKEKTDNKLTKMLAKDVTGFVTKMNEHLVKKEQPKPEKKAPAINDKQSLEIKCLTEERDHLHKLNHQLTQENNLLRQQIGQIDSLVIKLNEAIKLPVASIEQKQVAYTSPVRFTKPTPPSVTRQANAPKRNSTLGKCAKAIIAFLAGYAEKDFTKAQVAIATGYSVGSGGFNNALSELNTKGFILRAGKLQANPDAMEEIQECIGFVEPLQFDLTTYRNNLGKCEKEIYDVLLKHPKTSFDKETLAEETETKYSHGSGGFNNALSRLNTLEIIERSNGFIRLNPELLELM